VEVGDVEVPCGSNMKMASSLSRTMESARLPHAALPAAVTRPTCHAPPRPTLHYRCPRRERETRSFLIRKKRSQEEQERRRKKNKERKRKEMKGMEKGKRKERTEGKTRKKEMHDLFSRNCNSQITLIKLFCIVKIENDSYIN
jgi:hypothetical protein